MTQQEAEEFVKVWQSSGSKTQIAERLGLSLRQVDGRGYRLRKQGVRLRDHRTERHDELDIDALNKIAAETPHVGT